MDLILLSFTADQQEESFDYLKSAFAASHSLVGYLIVETNI
jgi:hypothetical protein